MRSCERLRSDGVAVVASKTAITVEQTARQQVSSKSLWLLL
jgi:hypothetical protein